jgi:hypothetical protein
MFQCDSGKAPSQAMPFAGIRWGRNERRRGQRDDGLTSKPGHRLHQFTRPNSGTIDLAVRRLVEIAGFARALTGGRRWPCFARLCTRSGARCARPAGYN